MKWARLETWTDGVLAMQHHSAQDIMEPKLSRVNNPTLAHTDVTRMNATTTSGVLLYLLTRMALSPLQLVRLLVHRMPLGVP